MKIYRGEDVLLDDETDATDADLLAEANARAAADSDLQDAIDAIVVSSGVTSVAGLVGVVGAAALKSALSLPTDTATSLAGLQPLDSDLSAIAALAPANDSIIQRKSSAWVARSIAQLKTDLNYLASEVVNTPAGGIAATTVQNAINELDTEKAPLASPVFTGAPSLPTGAIVASQAYGDKSTAPANTSWVVLANGYVRKTVDETVAASTALQDDDDLVFTVVANSVYEVVHNMWFLPNNVTNGGFKIALSVPAAASYTPILVTATGSPVNLASDTVFYTAASAGDTTSGTKLSLRTLVNVGANAGTVKLRWAQNSASNNTLLKAGSWQTVRRVA